MKPTSTTSAVQTAIEIAINLLMVFLLLYWCLKILSPFIPLILWAAVIAVSLYKPFLKVQGMLGGRKKLAVVLFALIGLAVVLVPGWMFVGSILESTNEIRSGLESGQLEIPPPGENVRNWPVVGEKVYSQWSEATNNLEAWIADNAVTIKALISGVFGKLTQVGISVMAFAVSILIATAFLANADHIVGGVRLLLRRLLGEQADEFMTLSSATVTSVAVGVLGIAFIQAVLAGAGMLAVGVPAAGILALLVLLVAIAQLPPWLILLPVIFYVFSVEESTLVATTFAIWSLAVSFADMVLKPLMLGRGVEAPMLVILLGAIGGLIMSGIIGLFVGAVVLALGYKLLEAWLLMNEESPADEPNAAS
ncbi:MAG: AI-2E family transporter [Gammaproteobacteria bacterium]|nr:AI-2E family transporter [Gammaproteobacteria bacterium]NNJ78358.1 AI-2E family transporter [Xanthomonadales bacterium]